MSGKRARAVRRANAEFLLALLTSLSKYLTPEGLRDVRKVMRRKRAVRTWRNLGVLEQW